MRIGRIVTTAAVIALGLAGCGDDDGDGTETPADTAPEGTATTDGEEATTGDGGEAGEGPTVTVAGIAFPGQPVTVAAGTPVTWVNEDQVAHTVTSGTPGDATGVFDEDLPAGGEATVTVDEPGTYAYFCEIHPSMTAELVVEASGG